MHRLSILAKFDSPARKSKVKDSERLKQGFQDMPGHQRHLKCLLDVHRRAPHSSLAKEAAKCFEDFSFGNDCRFTPSSKNSTEWPRMPFIQLPPVITSCIITVLYHTNECTHLYVCCVCVCIYFYAVLPHVQICATTNQDTDLFHQYQALPCYPFIAAITSPTNRVPKTCHHQHVPHLKNVLQRDSCTV